MSSFTRAVAFILLAIFLFDVQGAIIKHLGDRYPIPLIATYRNIFGLIPSFCLLFFSSQWKSGDRSIGLSQWRLAILRGISIAFAQYCFYLSITLMEFATATTLAFAGPLFITALSVPILKAQVGWARWLAVSIGFVGIIMVMRPSQSALQLLAALPLAAAFGYALSSVLVRLFDTSASTAKINLYTTLATLTCSVALAWWTGSFEPVASLRDWMWFFAMGMAGGFAVFCMIIAYRLTQPGNLSPFEYFGIPFSFIIGWVFFEEAPYGTLFPGVLLIIGGGLLIVWREKRRTARED
ncbi:MAG: DMT family transporter [Acidiferrobacterales bacterium]|nr:DMT family transporter [Acidiferrobacterales bacterium]